MIQSRPQPNPSGELKGASEQDQLMAIFALLSKGQLAETTRMLARRPNTAKRDAGCPSILVLALQVRQAAGASVWTVPAHLDDCAQR